MSYDVKNVILTCQPFICYIPPCQAHSFTAVGFKVRKIGTDTFKLFLPKGWNIIQASNDWTSIVDEHNHIRAVTEATSMSIRLLPRFRCDISHIDNDWGAPIEITVKDTDGSVIFKAGQCEEAYSKDFKRLLEEAKQYLFLTYPEWNDPTKYWDIVI